MDDDYRRVPSDDIEASIAFALSQNRGLLPRKGRADWTESYSAIARAVAEHLERSRIACYRKPPPPWHSSSPTPVDDDGAAKADILMNQATALKRFAGQAGRDYADIKSDGALFRGTFHGVFILLAFATEVALKAWQRRDSGDHESGHHLLRLYESERITDSSRAAIADAVEGVTFGVYGDLPRELPSLAMGYPPDAETYVRAVLESHAATLSEMRCGVETVARTEGAMEHTRHIERVLGTLIRAFRDTA